MQLSHALVFHMPKPAPFLNKTSLTKFFCLFKSGFPKAIYDAWYHTMVYGNLTYLGTIYCSNGSLILMNKKTLKDWFYLEMVSYRAINNIIQLPRRKCIFSSFQFVALSLNALDN